MASSSELRGVVDAVLGAPPRLGPVRLVAVDGPSGSGKSTCAAALVDEVRIALAAGDPASAVALVGTDEFATWDCPVAWWPRLVSGVLRPFAAGLPARYRRTEWACGVPLPGTWVTIATPQVLVLEGVSAGRRSISPFLSALLWLELPERERLERAVGRDGESSRERLTTWQNFESGWFAADGAARRATHRPSTGGVVSAQRTVR